jgi:serine/threonine protein kinase
MNLDTLCISCMEDDSGAPVCPKCGASAQIPHTNNLQLAPRTVLRQQYLIGRALGHGGFGITYLAYDIGLQSRLAIKEYMPSGVAGRSAPKPTVAPFNERMQEEYEWGLDRFLEEARTLKKFSTHPNIVSVDTIFRDNGTAYMVMEYLDGMTLEEFLKRRGGKVTFETAVRILQPVMDALAVVHAEGILHRDISPDNISLSKTGKVKLMDFGAARNALSQKSRNLSVILKEGYAPEEQYRSSGIQGPWTDVYATAATMYHCITGRIPQPSLDRAADDRLEPPTQLGNPMPPAAEAALMKGMAVRASDRYQSMEDFRGAITGEPMPRPMAPPVVQTAQPPMPQGPPPQPSAPSSMAPTVALGAAGVVLGAAEAMQSARPSAPPVPPQAPPSYMPPTVPVQSQQQPFAPPQSQQPPQQPQQQWAPPPQSQQPPQQAQQPWMPPQSQQPPQYPPPQQQWAPPQSQQPPQQQYPPQSQQQQYMPPQQQGYSQQPPQQQGYPPQQQSYAPPQSQQQYGQPPQTGQPPAKSGSPKWLIPAVALLVILLGGGAAVAMKYGLIPGMGKANGTAAGDPKAPAPAPPAGSEPPPAVQSNGSGPVQSDDDRQKRVEEDYQNKPQDASDQDGNDQGQAQDQAQDQGQDQQQADAPAAVPVATRRGVAVATAPPAVAVAPAPVAAAPVAVAAAPVPVVVAAPGYDKMIAQAEDLINNSQYEEATAVLKKAIASNPARWQAYNSLAKVELYFTHDPTAAFQNYGASLSHGGQASFYVYHDHGTGEFSSTCSGWLTVSRGKASFKADDGIHSFPPTPVKEAKKNKFFGKIFSASGKSAHAFHVHLMNNQNLNLAPSSGVPGPETDFIVKAIGAGAGE